MTDSPYSVESLGETWQKMRRHPHALAMRVLAVGADGTRAETFEAGLGQNLSEISRRIHRTDQDGLPSYRFGPLLAFEHSKVDGASRNIYVPRVRDQLVLRVMHDVVCASAQSRLEISLKPPKPVEMIDRFRRDASGIPFPFVLRTDIQSFFESVSRDRVVEQAAGLIEEPITQSLLHRWPDLPGIRDEDAISRWRAYRPAFRYLLPWPSYIWLIWTVKPRYGSIGFATLMTSWFYVNQKQKLMLRRNGRGARSRTSAFPCLCLRRRLEACRTVCRGWG